MLICVAFATLLVGCKKDETIQTKSTSFEQKKKYVNKKKTNLIIKSVNFRHFIEDVQFNISSNEIFVNNFLMSSQNGNLTEKQKNKMLEILNIKNKNVSELEKYNQKHNVYQSIENFNFSKAYSTSETPCQKLVRIRNAMLDECAKYPWIIADYCSAAVMLAYLWKSRGC